jgi:hypothetical protein
MRSRHDDIFAVLPRDARAKLMRRTVMAMMGPKMGDKLWKQMEPALNDMRRQPGDAPRPEDNYWKGRWRIHEAE